jgi:hypothetical protein
VTTEQRPSLPAEIQALTEGHVPYEGGLNQPVERSPKATNARPETPVMPVVADVVIVDVVQLEAERREWELARMRAYTRRRYHDTKAAALAGDPAAQERWERWQEKNRENQRHRRQNPPETRERELEQMRARNHRQYDGTKAAALAGDEEARQRWERVRRQRREATQRWRQKQKKLQPESVLRPEIAEGEIVDVAKGVSI